MKKISIVTPCFNEEENVYECYSQIKKLFSNELADYNYEHIFIDNASNDNTVTILKDIAKSDKNVKIIINSRNFGHIKSPFYGLLQAKGDAVILFVADLQDPVSLIPEFVKQWENGYKTVVGVKKTSEENRLMFTIRKLYYRLINKLSNIDLIDNFNGFGLYDRKVIDILKTINDPYPYFRGLIAEISLDIYKIEYDQLSRKKGITKNNFYTLYDIGMLGIISHSIVPIRIATFAGFTLSAISLLIALGYLTLKLLFWNTFIFGIAPILIGLFFFSSVLLFFIGILGEYIASIQNYVKKRDLVIEKERVNFDD
jgi:glycosyltransferase involved in cell wall biosynthesis